MHSVKQKLALALLILIMAAAPAGQVLAGDCSRSSDLQSCSTSYGVNEVFFGSGGELNGCSTSYCSKQSAGELTVGNTKSANYQAQGGFNTDRIPSLTFVINTTSLNVGTLTDSSTHVGTATFSIKTYLASGYQITTNAPPPTNGSYTMATPVSATSPTTGTEIFGMNLIANTCPASAPGSGPGSCTGSLGANPSCQTSGFCNLSDITIASNYNQADKFYYPTSGNDTLVTSTSSSDTTNYTISYIFDISKVTPGGTYTMNHVLVATSTF